MWEETAQMCFLWGHLYLFKLSISVVFRCAAFMSFCLTACTNIDACEWSLQRLCSNTTVGPLMSVFALVSAIFISVVHCGSVHCFWSLTACPHAKQAPQYPDQQQWAPAQRLDENENDTVEWQTCIVKMAAWNRQWRKLGTSPFCLALQLICCLIASGSGLACYHGGA